MKTILSFGAHPDDIEIGCGGTEIKAIGNNHSVFHAILTAGESGSQSVSKDALAATRKKEALASAQTMGVRDVFFLDMEDGLTSYTREHKMAVIRLIREIKPDIIFVHGSFETFPDHQICHNLVMDAITGASGPWYQEVSLPPWKPKVVLGYEVWNPMQAFHLAVPIENELALKLQSLMEHKSQLDSVPYQKAVQGLAGYRGVMSFSGHFAEVFEVLNIDYCFNLKEIFGCQQRDI